MGRMSRRASNKVGLVSKADVTSPAPLVASLAAIDSAKATIKVIIEIPDIAGLPDDRLCELAHMRDGQWSAPS